MKVFVAIILLSMSISAFGDNPEKLLGKWTEYWYPTGDEADVSYSDTVSIFLNESGELSMVCTNDDVYILDNIRYEDNILIFRKENTSAIDDDETRFYIYYSLVLHDDDKTMKGGIVNSVQQTNPIKWTKIEE